MFGAGTGPIFVGRLNCTGMEANLTLCSAAVNPSMCTHAMDAGVACSTNGKFTAFCLRRTCQTFYTLVTYRLYFAKKNMIKGVEF